MTAYYNENDPKAAAWLRELIKVGHIVSGDVDERSILDVTPADVAGYTQCHFFAGIGGWSYALRLAGWSDARQVWTGSCPCQPFSAAGKGDGFADERHLWPAWHHIIAICRPSVVFGEQVASKDGLNWFDLVHADLENAGYAVGAADLCAAGVEAPHIRQRLWFVADRQSYRWRQERQDAGRLVEGDSPQGWPAGFESGGLSGGAVIPESEQTRISRCSRQSRGAETGELVFADSSGRTARSEAASPNGYGYPPLSASRWFDCEWVECIDDKWRPVEPGTFPVAHGIPARMGRLRGYGNAIVPQVAATFIEAYLDVVN